MESYAVTERTKLARRPMRARYEREVVHAILDEALVCHVGFVLEGQPYVIPTAHWREGDWLYLHGSSVSRMLLALGEGAPVCVTVTLMDALVLARSAFHHSINYRSVVVLGKAQPVTDENEKMRALERFVEHVIPGRWAEVRQPTSEELKITAVLKIPLNEVSAKIRDAGAIDDDKDMAWPVWAGVLPFSMQMGAPEPDDKMNGAIPAPSYVSGYARRKK